MKRYPWLNRAYSQLVSPVIQQRAHHAWLLSFVSGSGENVLVQHFIARLLCLSPQGEEPCGKCHSCLLFHAHTHPDYYHIEVEKDKKFISVDQIRKLTEKVYEHAQQGGAKVIWIEQASLMTEAAANALLKTLEEPPANTYFILTDNKIQQLMATIRSRCSQFHVPLPTLDEGIKWLQKMHHQHNENQLATALLLNENAPLAADDLLQDANWQIRQQFCQMLTQVVDQKQFWALLSQLNSAHALTEIEWFCSFLLDAIKAKNRAGKFVYNRDNVPLIRLLARFDVSIINKWYQLWTQAAQHLKTISGLNQELILADLLAQSELVIDS